MIKFLFFFVDGIGLGDKDPSRNPFMVANMPVLGELLSGRRLYSGQAPTHTWQASLIALDACLGVPGVPQSATGQAAILTGINIPEAVGYHFGPWPNQAVTDFLRNGNIFSQVRKSGRSATFLNAYPPRYFEEVESGHRLNSAIPLAVISAGIPLKSVDDLKTGTAISADFTAKAWRERLNVPDVPILTPYQAGQRMAEIADKHDFSFFEYWLSDYAGHNQSMEDACNILEDIDQALGGLVSRWDHQNGLILITSDHGNMEDLSTRRHTRNLVPAITIGAPHLRREFLRGLHDLTDLAPAIFRFLSED